MVLDLTVGRSKSVYQSHGVGLQKLSELVVWLLPCATQDYHDPDPTDHFPRMKLVKDDQKQLRVGKS